MAAMDTDTPPSPSSFHGGTIPWWRIPEIILAANNHFFNFILPKILN